MAPPKKDAFADLFLSAAGSGLSSPLNSNMNKLSLQEQLHTKKPPTSQSPFNNWDVLSSGNSTPPPANKPSNIDPFLVFETKKSPPSNIDDDLLFGLGEPSKPSAPAKSSGTPVNKATESLVGNLLDDDFTDAYTPEPEPVPVKEPEPEIRQPVAQKPTDFRELEESGEPGRDSVLAGLVDIGFSVESSNKAIDEVGPDLQSCVNYIMSGGERTPASAPSRSSRSSRNQEQRGRDSPLSQQDLGAAFQDFSTDMFKKASWFLAKSKETVTKNIEQFQNSRDRDGQGSMPAWMRQQEEYRERALERKKDGTTFEDYGTDAENIDQEEIQRIMKLQKQREKERQKQRIDKLKEGVTRSSRDSLARLSPQPQMPQRPSLASVSRGETPPAKPSRPVSQPVHPNGQRTKPAPAPAPAPVEDDLLGLSDGSLTPSERFKASQKDDAAYVSPARRRRAQTPSKPRVATAEPLNAFQQSDYETFKAKGTESFTNGDYDDAFNSYSKCLESLPGKHELRIVITSNLAITNIKLGNYKLAMQQCDDGIALVGENINDSDWVLNNKEIKYWYVKLLIRKAESLEMLENFPASLDCYMELISKHGINEKKVMDAKRRVNNIVNPPKPAPKKAAPRPTSTPTSANNAQVRKIRKHNIDEKEQEEKKFKLHDQVHERVQAWSGGKEDNLRNLLMSLSDVLPQRLGFPFITDKKLTINDLMLTKKVKINYMKVISAIHPDKLGKFELEDQMVCQAVFITLNKAWDTFKEQNDIA